MAPSASQEITYEQFRQLRASALGPHRPGAAREARGWGAEGRLMLASGAVRVTVAPPQLLLHLHRAQLEYGEAVKEARRKIQVLLAEVAETHTFTAAQRELLEQRREELTALTRVSGLVDDTLAKLQDDTAHELRQLRVAYAELAVHLTSLQADMRSAQGEHTFRRAAQAYMAGNERSLLMSRRTHELEAGSAAGSEPFIQLKPARLQRKFDPRGLVLAV